MAFNYKFFNDINGDRTYNANDWSSYFATFFSNGVFRNPSTGGTEYGLKVVSSGVGMNVYIEPGRAFINGRACENDASVSFTLESDSFSATDRTDRVVIRLDLQSREIYPIILKGIYNNNATPPELTRNNEIYDICLADIYIYKGQTTNLTMAQIQDRRGDSDLCGFVTVLPGGEGIREAISDVVINNHYGETLDLNSFLGQGEHRIVAQNLLNAPTEHTGSNGTLHPDTTRGVLLSATSLGNGSGFQMLRTRDTLDENPETVETDAFIWTRIITGGFFHEWVPVTRNGTYRHNVILSSTVSGVAYNVHVDVVNGSKDTITMGELSKIAGTFGYPCGYNRYSTGRPSSGLIQALGTNSVGLVYSGSSSDATSTTIISDTITKLS
jgi:hypothetical protein